MNSPAVTFIHRIDAEVPRYTLVEKPITKSRAIELWTRRVRAAEEELNAALATPLATTEYVYEEATDPSQETSCEYTTVLRPEVLRLSSEAGHNSHDWLSKELKTKIQISE